MKLGEKIRYLREVEGSLRGLGRPMTQQEIVHAIRQELPPGRSSARTSSQASPRTSPRSSSRTSSRTSGQRGATISQSYMSQIENGSRPHMTQSSRALLARFFKVHPGFLVDDPEGYHTELTSDLRTTEGKLDVWLLQGSERFAGDPEISDVLIKCAREKDTRRCLLLLGAILETPGLAERLLDALRPELASRNPGRDRTARENHGRENHGGENHGRASAEGRRIR